MAESEQDILTEIRDRFKIAYDADSDNFNDALDDLNFANGDHWPQALKAQRTADERPCLTINKIPTFADQVIGDIRQNEPSIKVKPVDSFGDPKTAEILGGLIRNIENTSNAEVAYDTAAESAVLCGVGAWRLGTRYASDQGFDQEIYISRIKNAFTVNWDPAAQAWDKTDAKYCFVTEKMPKEEFKRLYKGAALMPFEGGRDKQSYWGDDRNIRIAEYWRVVETKSNLYLVQARATGQQMILDRIPPDKENFSVLKEREVDARRLEVFKATQHEILEGPTDWPGQYIPIIMVYGKEINIEGKTVLRGVVRNAKDPARLYNYSRSMSAEVISLAPKAPYLVTAKQIGNYQKIWDQAHKKNFPYLPYDVDPGNPAAIPKRADPIGVNTGIQAEVMTSDQEMRDTTGIQQASLGMKSNETSGKAILARQREGDVGNFAYYDNLGRAMKYQGKVLVDLIPKIYDTARVVRILNLDGSDEQVPVNRPFPEQKPDGSIGERIYDLSVGKYDVVVTIGPSFTTQREEAYTGLMEFAKVVGPQAAMLMADLIAKNSDWPGATEIEKRFKSLLPPALQQGEDGGPPPPPPPPDPAQMIAMRGQTAEVQGKEIDNEMKFHQMQREKAGVTEKGERA